MTRYAEAQDMLKIACREANGTFDQGTEDIMPETQDKIHTAQCQTETGTMTVESDYDGNVANVKVQGNDPEKSFGATGLVESEAVQITHEGNAIVANTFEGHQLKIHNEDDKDYGGGY